MTKQKSIFRKSQYLLKKRVRKKRKKSKKIKM